VFLAAVLLAAALPTAAHEVLHEVQRGRAVAVRAWFPDGESLTYVPAEVFSPADPAIPHWKGRTDRNGWIAFVPDVEGQWRVRIVDASGHGLDTTVEVAVPGGPTGAPSPASSLAVSLRPLLGAAAIAAIFGFLWWRGRRSRR
jgi:nickel transport protein